MTLATYGPNIGLAPITNGVATFAGIYQVGSDRTHYDVSYFQDGSISTYFATPSGSTFSNNEFYIYYKFGAYQNPNKKSIRKVVIKVPETSGVSYIDNYIYYGTEFNSSISQGSIAITWNLIAQSGGIKTYEAILPNTIGAKALWGIRFNYPTGTTKIYEFEIYEIVTEATAPVAASSVQVSNSILNGSYTNAITWVDNSNDESCFYVYRSINSTNNWQLINTTAANATSYNDSLGVSPTWGTYYYKIVAHNSLGNSPDSNIASVAVNEPPPAQPTNLVSSQDNDSNNNRIITLNWADNASNETEYRVAQSFNSGTYTEIQVLMPGSTTTTVNLGPTPNVGDYSYKVAAVKNGNYSDWSNITTQTIQNLSYSYVILL